MPLCITRFAGEGFIVEPDVHVQVYHVCRKSGRVSLRITAPSQVRILRDEVAERIAGGERDRLQPTSEQ